MASAAAAVFGSSKGRSKKNDKCGLWPEKLDGQG